MSDLESESNPSIRVLILPPQFSRPPGPPLNRLGGGLGSMGVCEKLPTMDFDLFVDVFFIVRSDS